MVLEEFDANEKAVINPEDLLEQVANFPKVGVSCFARETFRRLVTRFSGREIFRTSIANVEIPIYQIDIDDNTLVLFNSPVGAPACIAILEDLQALGMEKLVLFGTCGVLGEEIKETSIIVPTSAIRDEGTSYHYMPASREVVVNRDTNHCLTAFLDDRSISYTMGKVWTTDAIFRETVGKLRARKAEGAICVDMECSAVAAWASFRHIKVCQFFYAADHLTEESWDARTLSNNVALDEKDLIAELVVALALELM